MYLTSAPSIFLAAIFVVISGCRDHSTPDAGAAPPPFHDVPFAGCAAVVRTNNQPVCELSESSRTLRVLLPSGLRTIEVPKEATLVTADAFLIAVRPTPKLPWLDEAKATRGKDPARAKEIVEPHVKDADPIAAALAEGMLARIELARGRADEAFPHFRAAIAGHRKTGRISDAVDDSFALAFALHQRSRRYDEARQALDGIMPELAFYPEGRAREPYYRGILASETGDHRGALTLLREATKRASALAMTKLVRNAQSSTALEMQELGRAVEADLILSSLSKELEKAPDASPCERAEIANNIGWGTMLRGEQPRVSLERSLGTGCTDAYVRGFALANLAHSALAEGDPTQAAKYLSEAKAAVTEPRGAERIEHRILEGRIALARGRAAEALAIFDQARELARAAVLLSPEWTALAGRAEAQIALGKNADAARTLLDAEKLVDEAALLVPLGEGRATFVGDRSKTARAAVELLVKLDRPADAARVARRSRARVLTGVERALRIASLGPKERAAWEEAVRAFRMERAAIDAAAADDWKLAADELKKAVETRREREAALRSSIEKAMSVVSTKTSDDANEDPPLAAGDLELVIHPTTKGWAAIVRDEKGALAYSAPSPDRAAADLGKDLLDRIGPRIEHASRVHVLAYGEWRKIDIHALPFHGAPLVDKIAVDYPVGLGVGRTTTKSDRVLVVGDPNGDLPSAAVEARAVATSFPHDRVVTFIRDEAKADAVSKELRSVGTFHYAGHGVFSGVEGWESALPLANGGRLGIDDVLSLAPAPARVVLSGCDSAKSVGDAEGLGLAQAFVAAGSSEVLAPVRPVADALAAKLASRVHRDQGPLADSLRKASAELRKEDPASDWAAFRVLAR